MSDTPYASLNGDRIIECDLTIPESGLWVADVTLALSGTIDDAVTLTIGNLSLVGHVARAAAYAGTRSLRIMGGFGGWRQQVERRQYRNPGGVNLSMVLRDAALEVGEQITIATDRSIGVAYTREEAPASNILRQLVGDAWWVDAVGVTQVGPRPTGAITSSLDVIHYSGAKGRFEVATETPGDWLPGRSFTAPTVPIEQTIRTVTHRVGTDGVGRLDVSTTVNRFAELVRAALPFLRYLGRHAYVVQSTDGTTVDVVPVDELAGLPSIPKCPLLPGILGEQVTPATGSLCLVEFMSADPTRGIVTGGDYTNPPTHAKLAGGGKPVARGSHSGVGPTLIATGDPVDCGSFIVHAPTPTAADFSTPGVGTFGYYAGGTLESIITAALAVANVPPGAAVRVPMSGKISDGSTKVESA